MSAPDAVSITVAIPLDLLPTVAQLLELAECAELADLAHGDEWDDAKRAEVAEAGTAADELAAYLGRIMVHLEGLTAGRLADLRALAAQAELHVVHDDPDQRDAGRDERPSR